MNDKTTKDNKEIDEDQWYVLRVLFGRELKLKEKLEEKKIKCFVPLRYVETEVNGITKRKLTSAIACILFINSKRAIIGDLMDEFSSTIPFRHLIDKATKQPMIVKDQDMYNFIAIAGNDELTEYVHYLGEEAKHLRRGEEVVVKSGIFKGIRGHIVRVKRQRRVMVELQGLANVVTAYIPNELLEKKITSDNIR